MQELVCPKCKNNVVSMCLPSMPPKYEIVCNCGFDMRWYERYNSTRFITQEEMDKHYKGI